MNIESKTARKALKKPKPDHSIQRELGIPDDPKPSEIKCPNKKRSAKIEGSPWLDTPTDNFSRECCCDFC